MPSPRLITMREMLELFGYRCEGKTPQAIWNAAERRRDKHKLKVKSMEVGPPLYYLSSVEAAINSQPDHQFQAAA